MTENLGPRESRNAETSENEVIAGTQGARSLIGQSGVLAARPGPGETVQIAAEPGQTYILDFVPSDAEVVIEGDHFVLVFADGGRLVFLNLVTLAQSDNPPILEVAGVPIGADVLISRTLALADPEAPLGVEATLETAAGPGGLGTGATQYSDNLGDVIDLLVAQGVIPPVFLQFGLIDLEPTTVEGEDEDGDADVVAAVGPPGEPVEEPEEPGEEEEREPIRILTNETSGELSIPTGFLLFLAGDRSLDLDDLLLLFDTTNDPEVIGPTGGSDTNPNAFIDSDDTWANVMGDTVEFHIGGFGPKTVGSELDGGFTLTVEDGGEETDTDILIKFKKEDNDGDLLTGTDGDDIMLGDDGPNTIDGGEGNDIIYSSHDTSEDELHGGDGDDIIFFGKNDLAFGEGDNDTFLVVGSLLGPSGAGKDGEIDGGTGEDTIILVDVLDDGTEDTLASWLSISSGSVDSQNTTTNTIELADFTSGTITLADGSEIDFTNIETIVYS